ncbi:PH and SEC7 domain-containing protein 3 isoform X2 [Dendropsophus ebraccatus]|uniref:PH and SEC7 domain-containing protein 3 isoform X2 n=1 Tax=Dendropsophus ebraccatus TaxID=150705 RepID=UPI0038322CD9
MAPATLGGCLHERKPADKAERYVWVNNTSAHSQNVAKAKYEFLFGEPKPTPDDKAPDDPGNTRLLPQAASVNNEFPEYGTTEHRENDTFRAACGRLDEQTQCPEDLGGLEEPRCPFTQNDYFQQCLHDEIKSGSQNLVEDDGDYNCSLDHHQTNRHSHPECNLLVGGNLENEQDSSNVPSPPPLKKVDGVMVPNQEEPSDAPTVHAPERKPSYMHVERELPAISEEETLSESSLSQITEIADFPKSSTSTVMDHSDGFMEGTVLTRVCVGENGGGATHSQSPLISVCLGNAATNGTDITTVQTEMAAGCEDNSPSTMEGKLNDTTSLISPGTNSYCPTPERTRTSVGATFSCVIQRPRSASDSCTHDGVDNEVFIKDTVPGDEISGRVRIPQSPRIVIDDQYEDTFRSKRYSEDSTDLYSSQFENILDNTSLYYSVESLDTLYYEPDSFFSFEMPLTPMIQQRIKESSQYMERNMSADVEQEFLQVDSGSGISMGYSNDVTNGLDDTTEAELSKTSEELDISGSDAGPSRRTLEASHDMGSTEILEKGSTENLSNGTNSNVQAAKRLAKRLYQLDGFKRSDVAKHLGKNNDFSKLVAEEYLKFFDFTGLSLDQSLRSFFKAFSLIGETQERERVLIHFSNRYFQCNPNTIFSPDGIHCLTCAIMLLNTDLHGHNIGKKMSCQEFIANLQGVNEGADFPRVLLKALYNSIKNEKLEWAADDDAMKKSPSDSNDDKSNGMGLKSVSRIGSSSNPFLDIPHDPNAAVYKAGFLARKIHADMDGKKTPRGKRGWKTFYAILKGTVLYLQKDEYKPEKALSEDDLKNAVSVHHALASKATDYEKRPNVLKLKTADWRVFLFQAQSTEEMESWINKINCVAAVFSAPPFPAAIGSQKKFSRPLLPATTTKLSKDEQLKSHETKLKQISTELAEHRSYPPDKKVKTKEIDEYKMKDHYLEFEKTRYEVYVQLLKDGGKDLLANGENDNSGLKKSHSSPSLTQDSSPASAKVKRNVSERKDYRPETPSIKQKVT